jgi:gliding motility-associated-like protein
MKKFILLIVTIPVAFLCYAQTDTAFWFAAPEVSSGGNYDRPIHVRLTSYLQPCTVTISQPAAGGLPTQTFSMLPNTTQSIDLTTWINNIECTPGNTIQNKGIKITSNNKISVYYEVNANGPNPEMFVLKGKNSLGDDFYISSQYLLSNSAILFPLPKSAFNIVATEDNTAITITPTNSIVGHAANIPFVINLNKGQTYAAIATSNLAAQHLQGSHVTSSKPIAITLSDDLLEGGPVYGGVCQDLTGDQTVPINIIGNEYIAIKSNLNSPFDKVYITASQNATSVMQDGVFITNLNTGQSTQLSVTNNSTYIQSSAPVYAYQLSGVGCEVGSTLLPKINCTGSSSVTVTRSTNESFFVTLLVRNGGQNSFLVNNVGGVITAAQFAVVPATGGLWYAAKVSLPLANYPNGSAITISNSSNIFQLGVLQGGILSGLAHGYFSDYNSLEAHASASATTVCVGSTIQLFADFIVSATYGWTGPNGFISNLQNPTIPNAALSNSGMYHLTVNVPGCGTYLDSVLVTVDICTIPCNNWLSTPSNPSYATAGDMDVSGTQLTVEANINRIPPLNNGLYYGHVVSKHTGPANVNYALSLTGCEITTTNGYTNTNAICDPSLNKTYHIAMVYNGSTLKFYRNGFLMSSVPCTGNMITNNLLTTIGEIAGNGYPFNNQVLGYINEVRVWNVARTQTELQTYMNSSLPNPTTTPGLLGYYTFDNLLNKQGNAAFNATLNGAATINNTNPNCTFVADSCPVAANSIIINTYTPVLALNPCDNRLTVENASTFNVGDTVLLIQMKGAVIDSTNTAAFGTVTDYKNAGNYEFNYVKSVSGNIIELKNMLTRQYDIPVGKVQLIRVPYYNGSLTTSDTLTCLPWDGNKGGVLVFNVRDTINLNADINVSGKGFRGGVNSNFALNTLACNLTNYYDNSTSTLTAKKGEGITLVGATKLNGRGKLGNGGGGGNGHNAGGGGGSNASFGGFGGYQLNNCGGAPFDNRGIGGQALTYNNTLNKVFLGGGGGAGHYDGPNGSGFYSNGGNGGGIVLINAGYLVSNNHVINSKGITGEDCIQSAFPCNHDGMAGGGAGGSVILGINTFVDNNVLNVNGGKGANLEVYTAAAGKVGPGGGGSGGVVWFKSAALPANSTVQNTGGVNGVIVPAANDPWGATPGSTGVNLFNLVVPVDNIPFRPNIDSVRIKDSLIACLSVDFKGLAYTNTNPISNWQWYFGDAGTANTQNTTHTYAAQGTYTVKLVVTDINGCKDSVLKPVTVNTCVTVIINDYTPVLGFNVCDNKLTVEDGTAYNVGDTVLLIQMKGAVIDSTNTSAFGTITDYKNSGNYEFNYVKTKVGNIIELKNRLTRQYDIPAGKVQLIRVPYYSGSLMVSDTLTCLPWDGSKGGVLVVNVRDSITLNTDINVSGKGFIGSQPITNIPPATLYNQTDYAYPANIVDGSRKGEGIAIVSENLIFCRGPLASGGGGANSHNAGGGGGGNGGAGGRGGNEWGGSATVLTNGGVGGKNYAYTPGNNKIFMGGAGGAGHANDGTGTAGGNGGGIVIINTNKIIPNSFKIISNGAQGPDCINIVVCKDGVGGGGAGGTILINAQTIANNFPVQTNGGRGAEVNVNGPNATGPGGGGGGGTLLVNSATLLTNITYSGTGGIAGRSLNQGNTNWGAINGNNGISAPGFIIPFSTVPFQKNIDSVRIKDSLLNCNGFDFKGLAYTNTNPIASWQWDFGDGGLANTQNTSHAYGAAGTYTVRLIVTDINGCIDSTSKDVDALPGVNAEAGSDTSICTNGTVSVMLNGTAVGGPYLWSPAIYLNNPNIQNPIATISSTTTFYLTVAGAASCTSVDSVTIYINPIPLVDTRTDTAICRSSPLVLTTSSNAATYLWSPAVYVSDPTIASPNYIDGFSHRVYVTGTSAAGCSAIDSVDVTVNPLPVVQTINDTTLCLAQSITLTTTGAQSYSWSPATGLNNPNIASPVFIGTTGQTYTVTGTDFNGCKNTDVVSVTIYSPEDFKSPPSFAICGQETIQLDGNNGTNVSYLWSPATWLSNPTIRNPLANPPQTMVYSLLVTENTCGFDSTFTVSVTILPAPVINARKSNDIDCAFRSATLSASGGDQYTWSPSTGLSSTSIPNPVAKPATTQKYTVLVTNSAGCTNTDSVTVVVNNTASLARYMPNAFTPDGNGINDCYGLKNWMYVQQLQFYIFNRYGEQVFGTSNPNTCWDGTYKGKPALAGTYVYVIKAQTNCGPEEQKGNFLLIR